MSNTITLLTEADKIEPQNGQVGLLFECAPDSSILDSYKNVIFLKSLIGDFEETKLMAYELTRILLAEEPQTRGIQQLSVFEEVIIGELKKIFHYIHLHQFLEKHRINKCLFNSSSHWSHGLMAVARDSNSFYTVDINCTRKHDNPVGRSLRRIIDNRFSSSLLRSEFRQVLNRIDPFFNRTYLTKFFHDKRFKKGEIWFYSTAYTFTNIGLIYDPYFPQKTNYLIENPLTGGRPLSEAKRRYNIIYDFIKPGMSPSKDEISEGIKRITEHLNKVKLNDDEKIVRDIFLQSSWFQMFSKRLFPTGLFQSTLFQNFIDKVKPSVVVVGNPVFESYLIHAAKKKNVPTVLLQHGILGDYCQFYDPPIDHYVVRGEFWQNFLAPSPRKRSIVLNAPKSGVENRINDIKYNEEKHILFLTVPYSSDPFFHSYDLLEILITLLQVSCLENKTIHIRVHPVESIEYYRTIIDRLISDHGFNVRVTYSQGAGLDSVIKQSYVAVMFSSTIFLDCIKYGIPIISFDWHHFSYKKLISDYGVFNFANNLSELRSLIKECLCAKISAFKGSKEIFIEDTSESKISTFFKKVVE